MGFLCVAAAHHFEGVGERAVRGADVGGMGERVCILRLARAGCIDDVEGAEEGAEVGTAAVFGFWLRFLFDAVFDWVGGQRVHFLL